MDRNFIGSINRAIDIVALRKESVDRNGRELLLRYQDKEGRSPQGERG